MIANEPLSVIPAQLGYLAIYNPSLGATDETLHDQIVFFYSAAQQASRSSDGTNASPDAPLAEGQSTNNKDDINDRLRKIGLAQGMINFAKNFSNDRPVDSIETEKSRIVLHELESGWWILASIDFTRISTANASSDSPAPVEYSSREIYPPQSLIQQLRRAHSIFLLHHGDSLEAFYKRVGRKSFCKLLSRFWNQFIRHWLVLLNGNPAVEQFNGVKLAVGGELGIGVGEEEWGSGEREVLEDYIYRTNGLLDIVVSRFGDVPATSPMSPSKSPVKDVENEASTWLGSDQTPRPSDGVIFSGVGAISRRSLATISHWMEWIYRYGEATYGVDENPSSGRSRRQRRARGKATPVFATPEATSPQKGTTDAHTRSLSTSPGIPPPLVVGTNKADSGSNTNGQEFEESGISAETVMKYLTLGYGSAWTIPGISKNTPERANMPTQVSRGQNHESSENIASKKNDGDVALGKFIIGLRDNLEEEVSDEENPNESVFFLPQKEQDTNQRTLLRTVLVEVAEQESCNDGQDTYTKYVNKKLQVLVYVRQPFMFTFLFDLRTTALALPSFYRSIHHQLGPLQRPLLSSTSPLNVSRRIYIADCDAGDKKRASSAILNPIYDLVYDPRNLTVRSSIPNIPEPGAPHSSSNNLADREAHWSRLEALNVHSQFLNTYLETRSRPLELDRTCKTSRGWWLIWVRIREDYNSSSQVPQHSSEATAANHIQQLTNPPLKEAFLIRKSLDSLSSSTTGSPRHGARESSSGIRFLRDLSGASSSAAAGAKGVDGNILTSGQVSEALGFDARQYIERLLSLNR